MQAGAPLDPYVEDSPEADVFALLDRPAIEPAEGLRSTDLPRVLGAHPRSVRRSSPLRPWTTIGSAPSAIASRSWPVRRSPRPIRGPRSSTHCRGPRWPFMWEFAPPERSIRRTSTAGMPRSIRGSCARSGPNTPLPYFQGRDGRSSREGGRRPRPVASRPPPDGTSRRRSERRKSRLRRPPVPARPPSR